MVTYEPAVERVHSLGGTERLIDVCLRAECVRLVFTLKRLSCRRRLVCA